MGQNKRRDNTCSSSCCTTCICTRHWAVLLSSRACSLLRCLENKKKKSWCQFDFAFCSSLDVKETKVLRCPVWWRNPVMEHNAKRMRGNVKVNIVRTFNMKRATFRKDYTQNQKKYFFEHTTMTLDISWQSCLLQLQLADKKNDWRISGWTPLLNYAQVPSCPFCSFQLRFASLNFAPFCGVFSVNCVIKIKRSQIKAGPNAEDNRTRRWDLSQTWIMAIIMRDYFIQGKMFSFPVRL